MKKKKEVRTAMSKDQEKLIKETVENLKHLDKTSLLIVKGSAEALRIRDTMDKQEKEVRL